jgi:hypothetical protein
MSGRGRSLDIYTGPITVYGYHRGDGAIDRIGGDLGGRSYIMITLHSGDLTEGTILYVSHTELSIKECTGRIERLLSPYITDITIELENIGQDILTGMDIINLVKTAIAVDERML